MLCPPDALEALRLVVLNSARMHCIAHVIVADAGVDGRNFLEPVFARMVAGAAAQAGRQRRRLSYGPSAA